MKLDDLVKWASNKSNFEKIQNYTEFCQEYLTFIHEGLQAVIVSRNETNYQFFQYREDGNFNVTRPINSDLFIPLDDFEKATDMFIGSFSDIQSLSVAEMSNLNKYVYTCQQAIGATLDALPSGKSNNARKINGDLFERYIRLLIKEVGLNVETGVVDVPIVINGRKIASMSYQHDLILKHDDTISAIGSVKTSSKDRIDKIFLDKFLYNRLTDTDTPHFAIFLNDVQRKGTERNYGINATFLSGHFIGYTITMNPLDGVYYCDLRPNMKTDPYLNQYIKSFDHLLTTDIWNFIKN